MAFVDSKNKEFIRRFWNLPILENWKTKLNKPLSYFGLPGAEIHDLLDWRDILGTRTGVEYVGSTTKQRQEADESVGLLNTNSLKNKLSSNLQLLRGDIEDIIINAIDANGTSPVLNDGKPAHLARFYYDLVNLDFCGGLGYKKNNNSTKRTQAIKKLFERQEGHSFVLLLTINVRDKLGDEVEDYLTDLRNRDRGANWHNIIDWYSERGEGQREYKLKAIIPSFIHSASETRSFKSKCLPPVVYEGHQKARMLHFVFELEAEPTRSLRSFSSQDDRDLIELPLLQCENGMLRLAQIQHPNFIFDTVEDHFAFLPNKTKQLILANTVPSKFWGG